MTDSDDDVSAAPPRREAPAGREAPSPPAWLRQWITEREAIELGRALADWRSLEPDDG